MSWTQDSWYRCQYMHEPERCRTTTQPDLRQHGKIFAIATEGYGHDELLRFDISGQQSKNLLGFSEFPPFRLDFADNSPRKFHPGPGTGIFSGTRISGISRLSMAQPRWY
jgi:hypothetical protein